MSVRGRYDHLDAAQLRAQLERRDRLTRYGLVWEQDGIEPDSAVNDDFVLLDLQPELCAAGPVEGWRNLVVEGDNWDALRALLPGLRGKVGCILIDPPYNTGNRDFTYNDRFVGADDRYRESVWLEFLGKRLALAQRLLAPDGVILACINDENRARLDLLMERVFGRAARVGSFVWRTKDTANNSRERGFSSVHEHVLVYANPGFRFRSRMAPTTKFRVLPGDTKPSRLDPITMAQPFSQRMNTYYPIQNPDTQLWYPCSPLRVWSIWSRQKPTRKKSAGPPIEELIARGRIHFASEEKPPFYFRDREELEQAILDGNVPLDGKRRPLLRLDVPDLDFWVGKPIAHGRPSLKTYQEGPEEVATPIGSWIASAGDTPARDDAELLQGQKQGAGTDHLLQVFGARVFDFPKPPDLIREILACSASHDGIILDFFAGSGTTAEAVLALNAEDDGDRRFIMVSNTEATADAPARNLCRDVCAERLRRALADTGRRLEGGFAYLRTRRIAPDDEAFDMDPPAVWTLLLLREGLPLRPYDSAVLVQSVPGDTETPGLAYLPAVTPAALGVLRGLAAAGPVHAYTPTPGPLREAEGLDGVVAEALPDRLLLDFKPHRTVTF